MLFMDIPRLKVPHDTPPLRGFGLLVSRVLQLRVSRAHLRHGPCHLKRGIRKIDGNPKIDKRSTKNRGQKGSKSTLKGEKSNARLLKNEPITNR
jgi:hypothetical protein